MACHGSQLVSYPTDAQLQNWNDIPPFRHTIYSDGDKCAGPSGRHVQPGDVDGNGHSDLNVFDGSSLNVFGWNGGAAGFGLASHQSFGPIVWAGMGDVDGNGRTDLVVYDGSSLKVYGWNGGAAGFGLASQQPFGSFKWAGMGDVDGNGHSTWSSTTALQ
jgi:hypothetical protein